jgi:hypothetical protein
LHPDEIPSLASHAGLEIDKLALFNNPLTHGYLKMEMMLRILPRGLVNRIEVATQHLPAPLCRKLLLQMGARFRKPSKTLQNPENS